MEEAQRAINAAHVEAESVENGVGVVKLMGRYSGKLRFLIIIPLHKIPFMQILDKISKINKCSMC